MGVKDRVEACGRCAMSTVVSLTDEDGRARNPFNGDRIEIPDNELRAVSRHVVFLGAVKNRLNKWATKITYGQ